ncbi:MAG TPA: cytochrome c [Terriglobales bacterium]|nr:cytochrome c [Terriglobales bacterium]
MKFSKLAILVGTIAVALFIMLPNLSWAEDGAALYKAKCAVCHGANGEGKPAAKIPSLVEEKTQKMSDAELTDFIANGGPNKKPTHAFEKKGVTPEQVKALVAHIREMAKK